MLKDIHDIRGPVMVGIDPALVRTGLWIAGGLLAAALVFIVVRMVLKRRKSQTADLPAIELILPHTAAVNALDRLKNGAGLDVKLFYFELGHILKAYIGATWQFNCLEMTTQELGRQLKQIRDLTPGLTSDILAFQQGCDTYRYAPEQVKSGSAGHIQFQADMIRDLSRAKVLVEAMETAKKQAQAETVAGDVEAV